ncbi:fructose-bisphosphatase class II, partial [Flavobacterium orientale]|uniref:fructose-bisphosphatase class II n=1 Tax=Flavobacterium orientale TaxID=1756020 RepID=UPI0021D2F4E8
TGIDMYMGSGGAPEGVLAAAALKCMGGQMWGKLMFRNDDKRGSRSFKGDRKGGRDFGGKRDGKRFEKGDKRGGFKGDKRGGRDFGGKRGGKKNFSVDFDDED